MTRNEAIPSEQSRFLRMVEGDGSEAVPYTNKMVTNESPGKFLGELLQSVVGLLRSEFFIDVAGVVFHVNIQEGTVDHVRNIQVAASPDLVASLQNQCLDALREYKAQFSEELSNRDMDMLESLIVALKLGDDDQVNNLADQIKNDSR